MRCPQQHHERLGRTQQQGWNVYRVEISDYILFRQKTVSKLRVSSCKEQFVYAQLGQLWKNQNGHGANQVWVDTPNLDKIRGSERTRAIRPEHCCNEENAKLEKNITWNGDQLVKKSTTTRVVLRAAGIECTHTQKKLYQVFQRVNHDVLLLPRARLNTLV